MYKKKCIKRPNLLLRAYIETTVRDIKYLPSPPCQIQCSIKELLIHPSQNIESMCTEDSNFLHKSTYTFICETMNIFLKSFSRYTPPPPPMVLTYPACPQTRKPYDTVMLSCEILRLRLYHQPVCVPN